MNNQEEINFYIKDRQYILQWNIPDESILNQVITFIFNDVRSQYKTDQLTLLDNNNQVIEDVLASGQRELFIRVNQEMDNGLRELKNYYIVSNSNLIVIKYKGERKLESVNYQIQTIKNLNYKYLETRALLRDKLDINAQQKSIERSANAYPVSRTPNLVRPLQQPINLKEYSLEEISQHNNEKSAWLVLEGKVYDVTLYIKQHPGGMEQILRGVGRDATKLFLDNHPWVNGSYILQHFQIGYIMN